MAAGPREAKSPAGGRDSSNNNGEPHWRTNSSFSPPPMRRWDCRLNSDGLPHGSHGVHGSSLSSNSRGSRSWLGSERYTNHHHSVSDGVLSYSDSPPDNVQEPRWTSPVQKFNLGQLATSTVGGNLNLIIIQLVDADCSLFFFFLSIAMPVQRLCSYLQVGTVRYKIFS